MSFVSGTSIWPGSMLRLAAIILSVLFLIKSHKYLSSNKVELEEKFKLGQEESEKEPEEEEEGPIPPTDITDIGPPPAEEGGPGLGRYAAYGAAVLALGLAAAAVIVWRRMRGRQA